MVVVVVVTFGVLVVFVACLKDCCCCCCLLLVPGCCCECEWAVLLAELSDGSELAACWLEFRANLPMRSWIELKILFSSSLVIIPSPFISYRVKIHLSCSSTVPLVSTDRPMTKSVNVISCLR